MPVVSFLVLIPKPKRMPLELETPCLFIRYVCIIIRHKNLKAKRLLRFFFFMAVWGPCEAFACSYSSLPSGYLKLFQGNRSRYSKDPGG